MSLSQLPQELVNHIVDYYCEGKLEDLKNLSLVSRSFLTPTRTHLFKHYSITSSETSQCFNRLVSQTALGLYIRELHISTFVGFPAWLTDLPNVHSLSFSDILYTSDPFVQSLSSSGNIHSIAFTGKSVFVRDTNLLQDFINGVIGLRAVKLSTYFQFRQWFPSHDEGEGLYEVEELTINFSDELRRYLDLRLNRNSAPLVTKKLVLLGVKRDDLTTVRGMLGQCRGALRYMSLQFASNYEPDETEECIDLSHLETLRCNVGSPGSATQAWWINSIYNTPSDDLEDMIIDGGCVGIDLCLILLQRNIQFYL